MDNTNQIIIYQSENGDTRIDVKFTGDTVWLSQQQMAELYQASRTNVVEHIKHIRRWATERLKECKSKTQRPHLTPRLFDISVRQQCMDTRSLRP